MAELGFPLYTASFQSTLGRQTSTKSIAGINLPAMADATARNSVAGDIQTLGQMFFAASLREYADATLTTKEEVN